jgi:protein-tyrosine phosphatase
MGMTLNEALAAVVDRVRARTLYTADIETDHEGVLLVHVNVPMEDHKKLEHKKTGPVLAAAREAAQEHGFKIAGGRASARGMSLLVEV